MNRKEFAEKVLKVVDKHRWGSTHDKAHAFERIEEMCNILDSEGIP